MESFHKGITFFHIVAVQKVTNDDGNMYDGGIGKDGNLLFHIRKDLQHFRKLTVNEIIVMGRKTFESLPRILENRVHIVLSRNIHKNMENVYFVTSWKECCNRIRELCKSQNKIPKAYIIGGQEIYKFSKPFTTFFHITEVIPTKPKVADTFYLDCNDMKLIQSTSWNATADKKYRFRFIMCTRS